MDLLLAMSLLLFVCLFVILCFSRALLPVYGAWIMVVAQGKGEDLWQRLYALMWLRNLGLLRCPIYILDGGLSPEGLVLVEHLQQRWQNIVLCQHCFPPEDRDT